MMRTNDILVTVQLTAMTCPTCGVTYGIDEAIRQRKQRDGGNYYCTNGHSLHYTETEIDRERKRVERLERDIKWNREMRQGAERQRDVAQRQAAAHKGVATKLKKRAAAGICPCCNRHFEQLHRHMNTQHPEFVAEAKAE